MAGHELTKSSMIALLLLMVSTASCSSVSESCNAPSDDGWEGEFFPEVGNVKYEGPNTENMMAFRYYNADELILGKPMKEWLRFSVAFWHTFRGDGSDPFGSPTKAWPWEDPSLPAMTMAKRRLRAQFEFLNKLGVDYWCFHDRDIAPEGSTWSETNANLDEIITLAEELQSKYGKKVLWGTAQLFKHPRYMHGAATSPYAQVLAFAGAQAKKAIEVTHRLGGENFVFWGGREGYHTLLNTDMKTELNNLAIFFRMAVDFKNKIGFKGTFLLEPKPQEPTKHQYDWDAATTIGFLSHYGLTKDFKLNIECNHATLAGHSCEHELQTASIRGMLGNIDANTGDPQTGWDTDQFVTDPKEALLMMAVVLKQGGLAPGGINFDAKLRRESTGVEDMFHAHISSMDALARGLRNAAKMAEDGLLSGHIAQRYSSFQNTEIGKKIMSGKAGFEDLEKYVLEDKGAVGFLTADVVPSGRAEYLERILDKYLI